MRRWSLVDGDCCLLDDCGRKSVPCVRVRAEGVTKSEKRRMRGRRSSSWAKKGRRWWWEARAEA